MKLWKHQQDLIDLNPDKWFLAHDTGTGKSLTLMTLAKNKGDKALVICPKSIVDKWKEDIVLHNVDADVISKDQFKLKPIPFYNTIIVDEAHFFSGHKSAITKTLMNYIKTHNPKHLYFATATPYLSTSYNVWTYLALFGHNISWYKWTSTFFTKVKMGNRTIPVERKTYNGKPMSEVMGEFLRKIGNFVKINDCFDVPEQVDLKETFDITAEQEKAFQEHHDLTPIVNYTKRLQIENGTLKLDNSFLTFKSEKLSRLLELISEHKKLVVVCRHRAEQEMISKAIKKKCFLIHGDVKNRHEIVKQSNEADECVVLVNASCSEGYQLSNKDLPPYKNFNLMVFYSLSNSYKDYVQMRGRILRADNLKKNVYIHLMVKGGIDEKVYKNIVVDRQDFHISMLS